MICIVHIAEDAEALIAVCGRQG